MKTIITENQNYYYKVSFIDKNGIEREGYVAKRNLKIIEQEEKIYLEGTKKSFDLPEFKSMEVAKNFINLLDTKELMLDMLNSGVAKDINVYIGDENENENLKDFSIVTFKHTVGDKDLGTIGIIGPKRMDYSKVISVMKYISNKLNRNEKDEQ